MFPNLFRSFKEIPAGISEHFKYPEDIFKIQCNVFQKYHMTDAMAFLNGDDLWEVSKDEKSVEADETVDEAPHVFMKLPKEKDRKSTRLNSSHANISYAVFCLKKKILHE